MDFSDIRAKLREPELYAEYVRLRDEVERLRKPAPAPGAEAAIEALGLQFDDSLEIHCNPTKGCYLVILCRDGSPSEAIAPTLSAALAALALAEATPPAAPEAKGESE